MNSLIGNLLNSNTVATIIGAILALVGVVFSVRSTQRRTQSSEQVAQERIQSESAAEFLKSVLTEVQSLRTAGELADTRITQMLAALQQAQLDVLQCQRDRNTMALEIDRCKVQIAELTKRLKELEDYS